MLPLLFLLLWQPLLLSQPQWAAWPVTAEAWGRVSQQELAWEVLLLAFCLRPASHHPYRAIIPTGSVLPAATLVFVPGLPPVCIPGVILFFST